MNVAEHTSIEDKVVSRENDQGRTRLKMKATDHIVNRRGGVLGGAMLAVASLGVIAPMQHAYAQALSAQSKPNILFMLVDNLGYGELRVYGGGATRGAPTPRIDRLAAEGMRLTNMNTEPQCTPRSYH
jgi:hypothetical protein